MDKIRSAIILAGGLGTRIRNVSKDLPKPMLPIKGKPFLYYIMKWLSKNQVENVVLSVGYKADRIINYFGDRFDNMTINYAIEDEPLGTGGAIKFASNLLTSKEESSFLVVNGDTFFPINVQHMYKLYKSFQDADISIALKFMDDTARYGTVVISDSRRIIGFIEKGESKSGYINGGIYVMNERIISMLPDGSFSFEKEFLERKILELNCYGIEFHEPFIDIGVPEDYFRAHNIVH